MCGKAQPYRQAAFSLLAIARLSLAMANNKRDCARKGKAFPHIGRQSRALLAISPGLL